MTAKKIEYVITVMARDRVGIVAGMVKAIAKQGGDVNAMSQTVMRGYFTIIVTASFGAAPDVAALRRAVEATGEPGELSVGVKEWEPGAEAEPVVQDSGVFVLSIIGRQRAGVLPALAGFLASRNINIIDLQSHVDDGQLVFISRVMVGRGMDIGQLQIDLETLFKKSGMSVRFQHENIFIATNRVDFLGGR